jgi:hypothetical protein
MPHPSQILLITGYKASFVMLKAKKRRVFILLAQTLGVGANKMPICQAACFGLISQKFVRVA